MTNLNKEIQLIKYTNNKLTNWYELAKRDYNIKGSAAAKIIDNEFIIEFTENGIQKCWSAAYYPEYLETQDINYYYNCWSELAQ